MANPFKWRHFQPEIIHLAVRWYLRYALSYRDLEEIIVERGLSLDHTTIYHWVQRYAPELDKRSRPHLKQDKLLPGKYQRRHSQYMNNIIEQDHRFMKRKIKPGLGFFSYPTAWRTIRGYEAMHMIRKGQIERADKGIFKRKTSSWHDCLA